MRILGCGCALLILLSTPVLADEEVNGYLHEVDGQRVLHVWGSHYEMGYAQGVLLGGEVMDLMHEYILALLPPSLYNLLPPIVSLLFTVPPEYREEAQGIVDGIRDSTDARIYPLGREIDMVDLLLANAVGDIGAMACSSQLAWGPSTDGDARLQGETAVCRNLDWALFGEDRYLLPKRTVVTVYTPTDPPGHTVAMVSFPGYFGCLSCMNELGQTAVINIAHNGIALWDIDFAERYTPIGVTLREALHRDDFNGDGVRDLTDVIEAVLDEKRSGATVINLAIPAAETPNDPVVVLEIDSAGYALRTPADEPDIPAHVLLATNDLRKLRKAMPCDRYETMRAALLERNGLLTLAEMWEIETLVEQHTWLSTTAQTMYFLPAEREMGVAFSDNEVCSPQKQPAVLAWDEIAELPPGVDLTEPDDDDAPDEDANNADDDDEETGGCS